MVLTTVPARFGVEEEFFVVDPGSREVVPLAGAVVAQARPGLGERVCGELTELQVETRTGVCGSAKEAYEQLAGARSAVAAAAVQLGVRLAAMGTPVLPGPVPPPITQGERQDRGNATFRALHDDIAICALHVHVEMPDRDLGVRVANALRPWLPVLGTLTANSPFFHGRDTGYASWRTTTWSRWPVAGPPPVFTSAAHYDAVVADMLAAGALVDTGTVFWDVRLSAKHPTLEIRVADVPLEVADAALFAAVVRGLVTVLSADPPTAAVRDEILRAAYWQAARDGLDGSGLDVVSAELVPAKELAMRLFETVRPVLAAAGEEAAAQGWFDELLRRGTGAEMQRAALANGGTAADVVDVVIAHTAN